MVTMAKLWGKATTKAAGDAAEARARAFLEDAGLALVAANYRPPGRGAADLDLVMRAHDGTLVFVEVRSRSAATHGGAAASISFAKRQRLVRAAQHFLMHYAELPPCRFDVVVVEGNAAPQWLQGAFDTGA